MSDTGDLNYLFYRQQVERSRAAAANSELTRSIHEQLAGQYERQIEQASAGRISFVRGTAMTHGNAEG